MPVSSLYVALAAVILIVLSVRVIRARVQFGVANGDGGHEALRRRIRAQANYLEYSPLFLVMLVVAEYNQLDASFLHGLALLFFGTRLSHAYGLSVAEMGQNGPSRFRMVGMIGTFTTLGVLAFILLAQSARLS